MNRTSFNRKLIDYEAEGINQQVVAQEITNFLLASEQNPYVPQNNLQKAIFAVGYASTDPERAAQNLEYLLSRCVGRHNPMRIEHKPESTELDLMVMTESQIRYLAYEGNIQCLIFICQKMLEQKDLPENDVIAIKKRMDYAEERRKLGEVKLARNRLDSGRN